MVDGDVRARRLAFMLAHVGSGRALLSRLVRDVVVFATFALGGLAGWRLAAIGVLLLGVAFVPRLLRGRRAGAMSERAGFVVALLAHAMALGVIALTGGLASPVLPGVLALVMAPARMYGGERHADRLSAIQVLSVAALALLPASVTAAPLPLAHHTVILVATLAWAFVAARSVMLRFREVTEAADRELHRLGEARVADAEAHTRRLQHVGARVAHELKNPLAAVKGLVQLVVRSVPPPRADRLGDVLGEIDRVEGTVRAYLSFSRPVEPAAAETPAALPSVEQLRLDRHRALLASIGGLLGRIAGLAATVVTAMLALMTFAGQSGERTGAMFALFVGAMVLHQATVRVVARRSGTFERTFLAGNLVGQLWIAGFVALSGGVHSPLLPMVAGNLVLTSLIAAIGVGRTVMLAAGITSTLVVIAFLPASITGPGYGRGYHEAALLLSLLWAFAIVRTFSIAIAAAGDRAEAAVEAARAARMRDAEAMTARLHQVAARVADELRGPLDGMHATVTAVLAETPEPRAAERLKVVVAEIARIQVIVGDYLSTTRPLEDLAPEPVDLAILAGESAAVVAGRAEHGEVAVELRTEPAPVHADPRRLREAMLNVLSNALDATPSGGKVQITTAATDGGGARVTIVDTGRGMSAEQLARLGTSYFTTRAEGTGLGVTLVQGVVDQHGGTLVYASEPGRGTRVTITLPPSRVR